MSRAKRRVRTARGDRGTRTQSLQAEKRLAVRLVANHLRSSRMPDDSWHRVTSLSQELQRFKHHRVIVVIGAGASLSAQLPDASTAIQRIRERLVVDRNTIQELNLELDRLSKVQGQDRDRFETVLKALSLTPWYERKVRDLLSELYGKRYVPILCYEIIAHLLKHRFVDAVVNFNFDELLDQSISDELNEDEYTRIVSDGDWPVQEPTGRLYIKPHGTASAPSSLRFTRDAYWGTPHSISAPLAQLFTNHPVIVISIGFSLGSFEFNEMLDAVKPSSELYCVDVVKPSPTPVLSRLKPRLIRVSKRADGLGRFLATVWQQIAESVMPTFPIRSIGRHELVSRVFAHRSAVASDGAADVKYFKDRTLMEICLSFAKGKGLINRSVLAHDRAGIYFGRLATPERDGSLIELCESLNLVCIGYGRETMTFNMSPAGDTPRIMNASEFDSAKTPMLRVLRNSLSHDASRNLADNQALFFRTLDQLYRDTEVEIRADASVNTRALFRRVTALDNATALSWQTSELLRTKRWDTLLVVAETGEWLLNQDEESLGQAQLVCLVVADRSKQPALQKRFRDKLRFRHLDWWDHNRHMTLCVHQQEPVGSIYFGRRMRSASVAPVALDAKDSTTVLELFIAYWIRANQSDQSDESHWISANRTKQHAAFFADIEAQPSRPGVVAGARQPERMRAGSLGAFPPVARK